MDAGRRIAFIAVDIVQPVAEHVRRYEIGGLIAQGGMAEILAACAVTEAGVSKRVALKRIRAAHCSDPDFVAHFFDEARLAMQLSHANIVQVFDFGRTEETEFFLVMELVEGVDLQRLRRADQCRPLPAAEALYIVAQALRGLDYAHRRCDPSGQPLGIIHLDVKPANVLISSEGEVKLTDFGVARSRHAQRPMLGISGTVPFMSPEQARGDRVDVRSDVYSAGVVLYALLTGSCPFGENVTERTLEKVRQGRYVSARDILDSDELETLLARALAPSPSARFPSAGAFADAIEELLFNRGWRAGAAALRDRVRQAFPKERERLDLLFSAGARGEDLQVARPASYSEGGTLLARVEAPQPRRDTLVVAAPLPRAFRSRAIAAAALFGVAAAGTAAAGTLLASRQRAHQVELDRALALVVPIAPDAGLGAAAVSLPAAADSTDAGSSAEAPAEPAAAARPPQPVAMGTLSVNANPWGTVYVNSRLAGTTPLLRFPVRAGIASVVVENPKLGRRAIQVKIEPKKDTPLIVNLRSASSREEGSP